MRKTRGPTGSVNGIAAEEVTAVLLKVVERLVEQHGLRYERAQARDELEALGVEPENIDGFLFSLQRTVPGIKNIEYGVYELPEDWELAVRERLYRYRPPLLDVLEAAKLNDMLWASELLPSDMPGLRRMEQQLRSKLGPSKFEEVVARLKREESS